MDGSASGAVEPPDHARIALRDAAMSSGVGDERVILELDSGVYYGVNPVGARIWELLEEPRTVAELRDRIAAEYDVTAEECGPDVRAFCADLLEADLAERVDG